MKLHKKIIEEFLEKGITLARYWGGIRHEEVVSIEYADFVHYNYSGIISGDEVVLMVNGFGIKRRQIT